MSSLGFSAFAVIIILAALAGLLFKKNGELAGLGRQSKRGGLRAPHGRLVRTKRLDAAEEIGFAKRFGILLGAMAAASAVLGGLHVFGALNANLFATAHLILCLAIPIGVARTDSGLWRPAAYALAGYVALAAIPALLWAFEVPPVAALSPQSVNLLSVAFGALGCALAVALMPGVCSYAREFEDGHVNAIQVASNSVARRAYDTLADPSWKPPASRIEHFRAAEGNLRSFMEKR